MRLNPKEGVRDPIVNEAANGLKNVRGAVAMARTSEVNSATCQFFVNLVDNDFLNCTPGAYMGEGYAVFGEISAGMEVVDKIASVPTDSKGFQMDVPVEDVIIKNVFIGQVIVVNKCCTLINTKNALTFAYHICFY